MSAKIENIKIEYDQNETGKYLLDLKTVAEFRQTNLCHCPMNKVSTAITLVAVEWNLRPNRAKEFKTIKKIVINSVLNN
jgi:hypothetical protein